MNPSSAILKPIVELGRALAPRKKQRSVIKTLRFIGFYPPVPGVGCSTLAYNTAVLLAASGKKVCLVDTNLTHPEAYRYLLSKSQEKRLRSISDKLLNPHMDINEFLCPTEYPGLFLVTASLQDSYQTWSDVSTYSVQEIYRQIITRVDYVIVDMFGTLNDEFNFVACDLLDLLLTVTDQRYSTIEAAIKDSFVLENYNFKAKIQYIIQNMIRIEAIPKSHLEKQGFVSLLELPYSNAVFSAVEAIEVFSSRNLDLAPADVIYRDGCRNLVEFILSSEISLGQEDEEEDRPDSDGGPDRDGETAAVGAAPETEVPEE